MFFMVFALFQNVFADLPVHCTYLEVLGDWFFYLDLHTFNASLEEPRTFCGRGMPGKVLELEKDSKFEFKSFFREQVRFELPNQAFSESLGTGTWTMVYDEGFILTFEEKVFNTFFFYYKTSEDYKSDCSRTTLGWYRSADPLNHQDWGCFYAEKTQKFQGFQYDDTQNSFLQTRMNIKQTKQIPIQFSMIDPPKKKRRAFDPFYLSQTDFNSLVHYWDTPLSDIDGDFLPVSWDWSDIQGTSFISSRVRQQQTCGSCYAITTCEMLESRLKILTNNSFNSSLSVQYLISCSFYTEGCQGGFPTLLHKFIQEFGLVEEECMEYLAADAKCKTSCPGKKVFVKDYYYVGGYYGATNEVDIMKEVRARGPVIIDLDPGNRFLRYQAGVLHESSNEKHSPGGLSLREKMIPWEKVTHSVLLVGWGQENGEKFWKCLNSWGNEWGEHGYFRIRKGFDEDDIESMAEAAVPFVLE